MHQQLGVVQLGPLGGSKVQLCGYLHADAASAQDVFDGMPDAQVLRQRQTGQNLGHSIRGPGPVGV